MTPRPGVQDGLLLWAAEKYSPVFLAMLEGGGVEAQAVCFLPGRLRARCLPSPPPGPFLHHQADPQFAKAECQVGSIARAENRSDCNWDLEEV